jgi:hypothetical protein
VAQGVGPEFKSQHRKDKKKERKKKRLDWRRGVPSLKYAGIPNAGDFGIKAW